MNKTFEKRSVKSFEVTNLILLFVFVLFYTFFVEIKSVKYDFVLSEFFPLLIISPFLIAGAITLKRIRGFSAFVLLLPIFRVFSGANSFGQSYNQYVLIGIIELVVFSITIVSTFVYLNKRLKIAKVFSILFLIVAQGYLAVESVWGLIGVNKSNYSLMYLKFSISSFASLLLLLILFICIIRAYKTIKPKKEPKVLKPKKDSQIGNADKIKEYKELLDLGIITQEEFEQKKKELLE